jgi:hypothetical protein
MISVVKQTADYPHHKLFEPPPVKRKIAACFPIEAFVFDQSDY